MEVAINSEVTADIAKAEGLSMPVLLILLLVIFGSLAAASLPLVIGGVAILGSFTVLRLLTMATTVSVYSLNITTILGLGLGIDYGLFMVTRFREELHRQPTIKQAVARTVATAGRTVAVSGVTVAAALTSLMLFPEDFLRSMGYGGVAPVAVDVLAALIVLPALLAVLGHRVNALRIRRSVARPPRDETGLAWYRLARSVMRRPAVYASVIMIGLLALGAPFLRISWGGTDARTLPATSTIRHVITSLALLLIIVVGAFSASGITFIKLMGVGMITALILDATVVRILLVPATMRLLGRANWWAPRPLRRLYARYGIKEEVQANSQENRREPARSAGGRLT
jgi:RND superfamily putative drug exporter